MSVLVGTDYLALYPAGEADEHGWATPGDDPVWAGRGALQLGAGLASVTATLGGGAGPHEPAATEVGQVFLPLDAPAVDGMSLLARGRRYVLSQTRSIADPTGGGLGCVVALVSEVGQWQ